MIVPVRSKHVGGYQYVMKYILPKCILWFTKYRNLMQG